MLFLLACVTEKTGETADETPSSDDDGTDPVVTGERATLEGDVTWAVDFGPDSEAAGMADCSYTRHYSGAEDRSAPWLCPECDTVFQLDVELTSGRTDCYEIGRAHV